LPDLGRVCALARNLCFTQPVESKVGNHQAVLENIRAHPYINLPAGHAGKLMLGNAKIDRLILDVWGLTPMSDTQRRDLLEILVNRDGKRSTRVTSQLPVTAWHESIGDPTLADAILDRLVHNVVMTFNLQKFQRNLFRMQSFWRIIGNMILRWDNVENKSAPFLCPGEAKEADLGIAGGQGQGIIFRNGEVVRKVPETQLADALVEEAQALATERLRVAEV
jgi:hypothetical protein